jgi:hypothetical protein
VGIPRLHIRPGNPDFLDLPWDLPVEEWGSPRLVSMPTGVHRHPVVFVAYEEGVYAVKEMPARLAAKEFDVLGSLRSLTNRAADPAGLVERYWVDPHREFSAAVITRYVEHSFPYRRLVSGAGFGARRTQMLDAVAGLLVELHIAGCYWGDCSLSNVLYRFDAGGIEAIMIDAETSETHPSLSTGQRLQDLEIMEINIAGEMADIAAMNEHPVAAADLDLGEDVTRRYHALWAELTDELVVDRNESYKIRERIGRINELGFSVMDIEIEPTEKGNVVRMQTRVGGRTFNTDQLRRLTGIEASENQAQVILGDLNYHLAKFGSTTSTGKSVGTFKWLTSTYEPLIARINEEWPKDEDPVQGYCDFLHHRMVLATARGEDIDNEEAYRSWVAAGFPGFPVEEDG